MCMANGKFGYGDCHIGQKFGEKSFPKMYKKLFGEIQFGEIILARTLKY